LTAKKGRNAPFLFFKNFFSGSCETLQLRAHLGPSHGERANGRAPVDQLLKLPLSLQREPEGLVEPAESSLVDHNISRLRLKPWNDIRVPHVPDEETTCSAVGPPWIDQRRTADVGPG